MRFLLVTATDLEVAPLVARLTPAPEAASSERLRAFLHASHQVDVLVTGVGMVATAFWCARVMTRQPYDFAVNLGVCGSFDPAFPIGTVVNVLTDCIAELGAEDGEAFITAEQLGLLGRSEFPFRGGLLLNSEPKGNRVVAKLPGATGITVNTVHGNDHSIARAVERFHPVVETMEGAAFMYACLVSGVRFAQVRAVSNMVEKRNRGAWKLAEAIEALNVVGLRVIEEA